MFSVCNLCQHVASLIRYPYLKIPMLHLHSGSLSAKPKGDSSKGVMSTGARIEPLMSAISTADGLFPSKDVLVWDRMWEWSTKNHHTDCREQPEAHARSADWAGRSMHTAKRRYVLSRWLH